MPPRLWCNFTVFQKLKFFISSSFPWGTHNGQAAREDGNPAQKLKAAIFITQNI